MSLKTPRRMLTSTPMSSRAVRVRVDAHLQDKPPVKKPLGRSVSDSRVLKHRKAPAAPVAVPTMVKRAATQVPAITSAELAAQKDGVVRVLSNAKEEWTLRLEAVRTMAKWVDAGVTHLREWPSLLDRVRTLLVKQAQDPRSLLMKEACDVIGKLALHMGAAFPADFFFEEMLPLSVVTIAVIRNSGSKAIDTIMQHVPIGAALGQVVHQLATHKHKVARAKCAEVLLHKLHRVQCAGDVPNAHLDALQGTLAKAVVDGVAEVRATSRACFHRFARHFPLRAEKLMATLSPSVQKLLKKRPLNDDMENAPNDKLTKKLAGKAAKRSALTSGVTSMTGLPVRKKSKKSKGDDAKKSKKKKKKAKALRGMSSGAVRVTAKPAKKKSKKEKGAKRKAPAEDVAAKKAKVEEPVQEEEEEEEVVLEELQAVALDTVETVDVEPLGGEQVMPASPNVRAVQK